MIPPPTPDTIENPPAEANRTLGCLFLSFLGLVGLAGLIFVVKFRGVGSSIALVPTRDLYVLLLAMVAAPLFLALIRRVSWLLPLLPIATLTLIYALFNPFGIPFSRDPIFNYQFASVLLQTGHWVPGSGVTLQAVTYSFYPASAIFNDEFSVLTRLPLSSTFLVAIPLLHLLVLPAAIYTIGHRMFGPQVAMGGVLFFMATPSILFNIPVQQEFALVFFVLTLMGLSILATNPSAEVAVGLRAGVVVFSSYVVLSHHLTSYFLAMWLAGLFFLPYMLEGYHAGKLASVDRSRLRRRRLLPVPSAPSEQAVRSGPILARYLLVFVLYSYFVSGPELYHHLVLLSGALTNIAQGAPPSAHAASVGQTFPLYQQVWIYLVLGTLLVVSFLVLRTLLPDRSRRFLVDNLLVSAIATLAMLPFLPTLFGFLSLREMEYSIPFAAPALAFWLTKRFLPWARRTMSRVRIPGPVAFRRAGPTLVALALAGLLFGGGCLVPIDVRDQFAPKSAVLIDSPLHIDQGSFALAQWARSHLNGTAHVWGDYLVYSVFGGFGEFRMHYYQYLLFNGSTISDLAWHAMAPGDYIVVDRYMTLVTPAFPGPETDQPSGPMTQAQVSKFNLPPYIDGVYQDSTFTIYEVLHKPRGL